MSIKVGGVDLASSALTSEMRIAVLEKIIDRMLSAPPYGSGTPWKWDTQELEHIRNTALEELKKKYPDAGIQIIPK